MYIWEDFLKKISSKSKKKYINNCFLKRKKHLYYTTFLYGSFFKGNKKYKYDMKVTKNYTKSLKFFFENAQMKPSKIKKLQGKICTNYYTVSV